jgi:hypothetical protein
MWDYSYLSVNYFESSLILSKSAIKEILVGSYNKAVSISWIASSNFLS